MLLGDMDVGDDNQMVTRLPEPPKNNLLLDCKDEEEGRTPLSYAAEMGHYHVAKRLLGTGNVDINTQDKNSQSLLIWAVKKGHSELVQLFLEMKNLNIGLVDNDYG